MTRQLLHHVKKAGLGLDGQTTTGSNGEILRKAFNAFISYGDADKVEEGLARSGKGAQQILTSLLAMNEFC